MVLHLLVHAHRGGKGPLGLNGIAESRHWVVVFAISLYQNQISQDTRFQPSYLILTSFVIFVSPDLELPCASFVFADETRLVAHSLFAWWTVLGSFPEEMAS